VSTPQKLFRGPPCLAVDRKGVGWGGVRSLLTASRRTNPDAVASIGPSEVILLGRKSNAFTFLSLEPLGAYRLTRRRTTSTDDVKYVMIASEKIGTANGHMIAASTADCSLPQLCMLPAAPASGHAALKLETN
jgi:hypothetical protein